MVMMLSTRQGSGVEIDALFGFVVSSSGTRLVKVIDAIDYALDRRLRATAPNTLSVVSATT